jgi:hypothetical protein
MAHPPARIRRGGSVAGAAACGFDGWPQAKLCLCPVPEIRVCFAAGQLAVFQGASDERIPGTGHFR